MASHLLVSSTAAAAAAPSSSSLRRSPHPLLAKKPSHLAAPAKSNRRRCISCSDGAKNGETRVDRRNMLLGLSGMYGAANLISAPGASALPVPAPPLDKCNPYSTDLNSGDPIPSCCLSGPPSESDVPDYVLPAVTQLRTRRPTYRMTAAQSEKYAAAVAAMRALPDDDPRSYKSQANIHCAYCNLTYHYNELSGDQVDIQVHNSWIFFAFHRWYMYFYERILGSLIDDPTFALPFWNWDNPRGMSMPQIFADPNSALYDPIRNQAHTVPSSIVDLSMSATPMDPLTTISSNLQVMHQEMVTGNADVYGFMGNALRRGTPPGPGPGAVERGSHTAVHIWLGDMTQDGHDMGNFATAGLDPVFYCHHSNVDRMWSIWDALPSSITGVPDKTISDPDFLNTSFLLYDETGQMVRVYARDCVRHLGMGYDYERVDLPWLNYTPAPQGAGAKSARARIAAAARPATEVLPVVLDRVVRVVVPKTKKGKADEVLVIEDIVVDTTKLLKFDVFVNDEDDEDDVGGIGKASYAGSYAQLPHKGGKPVTSSIRLKLTDIYEDMDVDDDDDVVVTLVPRHQGGGLSIGGIKIVANKAS